MDDSRFMDMALALGERGMGITWPNPSVGCVIVNNGCVVGRGWTQPGGRPHAETEALKMAGEAARGATAYVTLEPCAHHGETPPCAEALVKAGITRAVIACRDPDPRTAGQGIARLKAAGAEVVEGVRETEARQAHAGFFLRVTENRPFVALKVATSLESKIATRSGESRWITGEVARAYGRMLRSRYDVLLTGIGTVLADNPQMTCRIPGLPTPLRAVVDTAARLPRESYLADVALAPTWLLTGDDTERAEARAALVAKGVEVLSLSSLGVSALLEALAARGVTRVLVEAGPRLTTAFLLSGLVDRLYWFRAPMLLGGDGKDVAGSLEVTKLMEARRFTCVETQVWGEDAMEVYDIVNLS
jgi:diaminohydroxyphosphoribosylaminopyrimidine deaminase/5-amino-6-(5-phosphoribosylamino)uracil reductase